MCEMPGPNYGIYCRITMISDPKEFAVFDKCACFCFRCCSLFRFFVYAELLCFIEIVVSFLFYLLNGKFQ